MFWQFISLKFLGRELRLCKIHLKLKSKSLYFFVFHKQNYKIFKKLQIVHNGNAKCFIVTIFIIV